MQWQWWLGENPTHLASLTQQVTWLSLTDMLSILVVFLWNNQKSFPLPRDCSQVRRIMTGCVLSATLRQMSSLFVSQSSHPRHLKTSKRRSVPECSFDWLRNNMALIFDAIYAALYCFFCLFVFGGFLDWHVGSGIYSVFLNLQITFYIMDYYY